MALPLQVDQADKRSEDLLKLHSENDDGNKAPVVDQDQKPIEKQFSDLQSKFDVLNGKYKKEIANADLKDLQRLENENLLLKREVDSLKGAIQENENLVKEVREELDKTKSQPPADVPVDVSSILDEEDIKHLDSEDLGGKTLEILLKLSRSAGGSDLENKIHNLLTRVDTMTKRVEQTESAQHQATIGSEVPELSAVNDAPEFHAWLDKTVNSFSSRRNRDDLQEAMNTGNFKSIRDGIAAFKAETGYGGKQKPKAKTPPIEPGEDFVTDGTPVVGKTYTIDQVKAFYEDQTKGIWVGREKEAAAIDRDILLAQTEGRITQ